MPWIISPRKRKGRKSAALSAQIDMCIADVFIVLPGHHKRPLARTSIICPVTMLACDSEMGFQSLHVHFREDFAVFQAKAQICSVVLLLLFSDKAPVCLLYTCSVIFLKELIVQTLLCLFNPLPYKENFAESIQKCFLFPFVSACLNLVVYYRYVCLVVQLLNEKVEELTFSWRDNQFSWNSCLNKLEIVPYSFFLTKKGWINRCFGSSL